MFKVNIPNILANIYAAKSHTHGNITNDGKLGTASRFVVTDSNKNITVQEKLGNITLDGKVGTTASKPLITTTNGVVTTGSFGSSSSTSATEFVACNDSRLSDSRTPTSHTHGSLTNDGKVGSASGKIITTGTGGAIQASDSITKSQISDFPSSMTPASHTHGNLTNDGKVGTASGKIITTGTGGAIQASDSITKSQISDFPSSMTPSSHNQATTTITNSETYSNLGSNLTNQKLINDAINTKIGALLSIELVTVVTSLGTASASTMNKLYLVAESSSKTNDAYEIYVTVRTGSSGNYSYAWEKVDTARIDLSGYSTTSHTHGNITKDGKVGTTANKPLITTTGGAITTGSFGSSTSTSSTEFVACNDSRLSDARTPKTHNQAATTITNDQAYNNIKAGESTTLTLTTQKLINDAINTKLASKVDTVSGKGLSTNDFNATYKGYVDNLVSSTATTKNAHVHGNITSDGKVGTTTGKPLITTTGGAVTTGSFGSSTSTSATEFVACNDSRLSNTRTPTDNTVSTAKIVNGAVTNEKLSATVIPNGTSSTHNSLNNYTSLGFYYQSLNTNTTYIDELPEAGKAFWLLVEDWGTNGDYTKQTLTHYNSNKTYTRVRNNGTWGTWTDLTKDTNTTYTAESTATNIKMNGTQSAGSLSTYAKGDHVHPSDTSRVAVSQGTGNSGKFLKVNSSGNVACESVTVPSKTSQLTNDSNFTTATGHSHASTAISNDQAYNNIKAGESTTLTLTTQKLINDAINTKLGSKVDTVSGKGLSTNDFNATYKGYVDNLVSSTATTKNAHVHGNITSDGKLGTASRFVVTDSNKNITVQEKLGNITLDGKVGTATGKPLITTTNGVVTTGSFGSSTSTSATEFVACSDSRLSDARTPTSHSHGNIANGGTVTQTTTTATDKIATIGASDNKIYSYTMTYSNGVFKIGG